MTYLTPFPPNSDDFSSPLDMQYVFGLPHVPETQELFTSTERTLSLQIMSYMANFIKSGYIFVPYCYAVVTSGVVRFYSCCFVLLFHSILLWTETPTYLCLCLECLSVSFYLPGLSSCPTQMDRTIRSCLLASVTTRASRHNSAPSGPSTCLFWAPLQVSESLYCLNWTGCGVFT